jgi:hypothetical protein
MPKIPALGRLRRMESSRSVSLSYKVRPCLTKQKNQKRIFLDSSENRVVYGWLTALFLSYKIKLPLTKYDC